MPYNIQVHIQQNRAEREEKKANIKIILLYTHFTVFSAPERDYVPTFQYRAPRIETNAEGSWFRTRAHARRRIALKHVRIVRHASGDVLVHHTYTSLHLHVYVGAVLEDSALPGRREHEGRRVVHVRVHGRELRIRTAARGVRSLLLLLVLVLLRSVRMLVCVCVCVCIREGLRVDQDRLRVLLLVLPVVLGLKLPIVLLANNLSVVLVVVVLPMGGRHWRQVGPPNFAVTSMLTGIRIGIDNRTSTPTSIPTSPTEQMTTIIAVPVRWRRGRRRRHRCHARHRRRRRPTRTHSRVNRARRPRQEVPLRAVRVRARARADSEPLAVRVCLVRHVPCMQMPRRCITAWDAGVGERTRAGQRVALEVALLLLLLHG